MKRVDTKGQACPAPIIAARKALKEIPAGESFQILTDSLVSYNNLIRYLRDNKAEVTSEENSGTWTLTVNRGATSVPLLQPDDYCSPEIAHFDKGDFVIVLSSDLLGEGDADLGSLLMTNFIKAVKDLDKLPAKMIFYNKGVTLAIEGSPNAEHLVQLEKMGVEIVLCATCVNHYGITDKITAGTLSNMFSIAGMMAEAGKVIKP
ncbi:MAG TPA: sulfurtransferase-like selenium metabolism protein YedF [Bacteroidales bacterium]|nr:sulfurtransferase-like selenium metabolism protein YedF [Bacteroidales bacterium]